MRKGKPLTLEKALATIVSAGPAVEGDAGSPRKKKEQRLGAEQKRGTKKDSSRASKAPARKKSKKSKKRSLR
jgi:hypothetical protein